MVDIFPSLKQYLLPALISVIAIGLLKVGLFVTYGDMERSFRLLEQSIRSEYATKQDIQDIKLLLTRVDMHLVKLDDRLTLLTQEQHP